MTNKIKGFATNNLVSGHDNYVKFMKKRWDYIKKEGKPTDVLFCKRGLVIETFGINTKEDQMKLNTLNKDITLWHCIVLSYDIWYDCVKDCVEEGHGSINYKKFVNVPDDILRKFKYRFEQSIKNAKCDYKRYTNPDQRNCLNACRYLVRFWTYLDLAKDCKTQRFFPNAATIKRAAKIFGYNSDENPFVMNGKFRKNAIRSNSEEKPVEEKKSSPEELATDILKIRVEDLGLTMRSRNALVRSGVKTVGDIVVMNIRKMLRIRNLGLGSIREIVTKLKEYGIEYKAEPTGVLNWDELPFVPKKEESVIDIAEEAAKRVEEEEKLAPNPKVGKTILRDEYEMLTETKKKYDELLKTSREIADRYDELLKQKLELDACNARLKDDILMLKEQNEVLKDQAKPSTDIIATFHKGIEIMKQHGISELSTNINGFSLEINQKPDYSIRTRPANQRFGG